MNNPKMESIRREADSLSNEEKRELAFYLISGSESKKYVVKETDLTRFYGTVSFPFEAMEFQNQVRSEWDH